MARQSARGRPRARTGVLAAVALIAAAGIIVFVLGQQSPPPSAQPHASPSSARFVAAALAALLRQGTPDTAPKYWRSPVRRWRLPPPARMTPGSARSAYCS